METTAHKLFTKVFKEIYLNASSLSKYKQEYSIDPSISLDIILDSIYIISPKGNAMEYINDLISDAREQDEDVDKTYKALEDNLTFYFKRAVPFIYNKSYQKYGDAKEYPEPSRIAEIENEFVSQCTQFLIALNLIDTKDNPRIINLIKPNATQIAKPDLIETAFLAVNTAKKLANAIDNATTYMLAMQSYVYVYELQENWTELEKLNLFDNDAMESLKLLIPVLAEFKTKFETQDISQISAGKKTINLITRKIDNTNFSNQVKDYLKSKI